MSENRNYRVRLFSRGDSADPLPPNEQPVLFDQSVIAHIGTGSEWAPPHVDATEALVAAEWAAWCNLPSSAYWNADATGPLIVMGIDFGEQTVPKHGLRVTYEELP